MVDQIQQKRILRPQNQWESHCLHRRPHIWNSRTSARHVIIKHTMELPLAQKLRLHQEWAIPLKDIPTCTSTYIYHICRTRHFRSKGQCYRNSAFKHTTWSTMLLRSSSDDASSINTLWFPLKTVACTFEARGGGDSDTCHQDYVVTWQRRRWLLSIQALVCF